jgi:hypothetical protein
MVVTSVSDSFHSDDSCHYSGNAFDLRYLGTRTGAINCVPAEQEAEANSWASRLRRVLGRDWDVVVEVDHIHVEYDPKHGDKT